MIKKTFFAFSLIFLALFAKANNFSTLNSEVSSPVIDTTPTIPRVFVLGQYDGSPFESMKGDYEATLASACKNDMELAFYSWVSLLKHMETFAGRTGYDLNGIKIWLYVFWSKEGNVDYIAYYPKPNSRNIKGDELTNFFNDFLKNYTFPIKNDKRFSNYSSANFPVMVEKPGGNGGGATTGNGKGNGNSVSGGRN
jgi:hypothetical protein